MASDALPLLVGEEALPPPGVLQPPPPLDHNGGGALYPPPPLAPNDGDTSRRCSRCAMVTVPWHDRRSCRANIVDLAASNRAPVPTPLQCGVCMEPVTVEDFQAGLTKTCAGFCTTRLFHTACLSEAPPEDDVWYCPQCTLNQWAPRAPLAALEEVPALPAGPPPAVLVGVPPGTPAGAAVPDPNSNADASAREAATQATVEAETQAAVAMEARIHEALNRRRSVNAPLGGGRGAPLPSHASNPQYPAFLAQGLGTTDVARAFNSEPELARYYADYIARQSAQLSGNGMLGGRLPPPASRAPTYHTPSRGAPPNPRLGLPFLGHPMPGFGPPRDPNDVALPPGPTSVEFSNPATLRAFSNSGELRKSALKIVDFMPANALSITEDEQTTVFKVVDGEITQEPKKKKRQPTDVTQWLQAHIQIVFVLVSCDNVPLEDLLVYTLRIIDYAQRFKWEYVLWFDKVFRDRQFALSLSWTYIDQSLFQAVLMRPEAAKPRSKPLDQTGAASEAVCRRFNSTSGCPFGAQCKFKHVCSKCGSTAHGLSTCTKK